MNLYGSKIVSNAIEIIPLILSMFNDSQKKKKTMFKEPRVEVSGNVPKDLLEHERIKCQYTNKLGL